MTDPLVNAFTGIFTGMSNFEAALIQFAFYGAYFCLAIPGVILIRKFSYKFGILAGLAMYIAGGMLFYPASQSMSFGAFLLAFYVLAGGLSILETAANPYIVSMGPSETGTQRLNLAQSFNPFGSLLGTWITQIFILKELERLAPEKAATTAPDKLNEIQAQELSIVMKPYFTVAAILVILWIVVAVVKMPKGQGEDENEAERQKGAVGRLLSNKSYLFAVLAQFFYVGAQICVWTYTVHYITGELDIKGSEALKYHTGALVLFGLARFGCTYLMSFMHAGKLLFVVSLIGVLLTLVTIFAGGIVGVYALIGISGAMSLMFPTIFGLGMEVAGQDGKTASSGLIMAILGGALFPLLQGYLIDVKSVPFSYIVPAVCFVVIALFGLNASKNSKFTTA